MNEEDWKAIGFVFFSGVLLADAIRLQHWAPLLLMVMFGGVSVWYLSRRLKQSVPPPQNNWRG